MKLCSAASALADQQGATAAIMTLANVNHGNLIGCVYMPL
jgi:hypothetical protein